MDRNDTILQEEGREIYRLLWAAGRETLVAFRHFSESYNLSFGKARALLYLHSGGIRSIGELAKELPTTLGWASRLAYGLTKRGLLECSRDRPNRRVVHVKLTGKGTQVAQELSTNVRKPFDDALQEVPTQYRRVIERFLRQFTLQLNQRTKGRI